MSDGLKSMKPINTILDEKVFCIAYGSNLCEARMKARCPDAEVFGTSVVHGYRLLFKRSLTGAYATIEQNANCKVPVVIYLITAEDEARLDRFEGYPRYYRKREFLLPVWKTDGKKRRKREYCIAYIMWESRLLDVPTEEYFSFLDLGYKRWGFDHKILFKGLEDSIGREPADKWLSEFYAKENGEP